MLARIKDNIWFFLWGLVFIALIFAKEPIKDVRASSFPGNTNHYQAWAAQNTLGAADTTKTLHAAPGTGLNLVVTNIYCTVITSAAQAVDVRDGTGGVFVLR